MRNKAKQVSRQEEKKIKKESQLTDKSPTTAMYVPDAKQISAPLTSATVQTLQNTVGNQAVSRLVAKPTAQVEDEEMKGIPSAETVEGEEPLAPAPLTTNEGGAVEDEEMVASTADVPTADVEQEKEKGIPSAMASVHPTAFLDKGMVDSAPAWWSGTSTSSLTGEDVAPAAFLDSGNLGNERIWWTEMNLNGPPWGARGSAGVGDYTETSAPVYKTSRDEKSKTAKAWIQPGTGTFSATRGYHGVNAGIQTGTTVYYLSKPAAARINLHEQGHTDQTRTVYQETLQKAEEKYHSESDALTTNGTEADAQSQLQAFWTQAKADFATNDRKANLPVSIASSSEATWDRSEAATADWYQNYGKKKLKNGTEVANYIKCKNETEYE